MERSLSLIFTVSVHLLLSVRSAVRDCVLWTPFPNPRAQRDNQCLPPRKARFPANWDYFRIARHPSVIGGKLQMEVPT
jgi:hypothetical protein